jgi:hypothetical protein
MSTPEPDPIPKPSSEKDRETVGGGSQQRRQLSGNPASAIYGTLVTAGVLVARGAGDRDVVELCLTVGGTLLVFWLGHAYTDLLGGAVATGQRTGPAALIHALRVEWPIVESGVLPVAATLLARGAGASANSAVLAGLLIAVVEICLWAVLAGRRLQLTPLARVSYVIVSGLLGLAIIALKALLH